MERRRRSRGHRERKTCVRRHGSGRWLWASCGRRKEQKMAFRGRGGGMNIMIMNNGAAMAILHDEEKTLACVLSYSHCLVALHWEHLESDHFSSANRKSQSTNQSINISKVVHAKVSCKCQSINCRGEM